MYQEVLPLRRASRELVRELGFLSQSWDPVKITHSQTHALIELEARGAMTQADLAAALRLDKSRASRVVAELVASRCVRADPGKDDARTRIVTLTAAGRAKVREVHAAANGRVEAALALLDESGRRTILRGMELYAQALERSRRRAAYALRPIKKSDCAAVARLIRKVMPEFGASGPGFAIVDPEVDDMFSAYSADGRRAAYFVLAGVEAGAIVGAGGFAPLAGGDAKTCELRKMYFLPEVRGLGFGRDLLARCIEDATRAGFSRMYLETLSAMKDARALYEKNGFEKLGAPLGHTGHFGCNAYYAKSLAVSRKPRKP